MEEILITKVDRIILRNRRFNLHNKGKEQYLHLKRMFSLKEEMIMMNYLKQSISEKLIGRRKNSSNNNKLSLVNLKNQGIQLQLVRENNLISNISN